MVPKRAFLAIPAIASLVLSSTAHGAAFDFDCDAPAERISSVSQAVRGNQPISGSITPRAYRAGKTPSLASVQYLAVDGKSGIALQFVIPNPQSQTLEVRVASLSKGQQTITPLGTAAMGKPDTHTFSFVLGTNGTAIVTVDGKAVSVPFPYLDQARASALCGSGQFTFQATTMAP